MYTIARTPSLSTVLLLRVSFSPSIAKIKRHADTFDRMDPPHRFDTFYTDDHKSVVTYGSAIKLRHVETNYYLNSEEKNLNSGSGQQIVTLIADAGSHNTLWWVRPKHDSERE